MQMTSPTGLTIDFPKVGTLKITMTVLYGDAGTSWLTWPVGRAQDGRQVPSGRKVILHLIGGGGRGND